jgi:hypothetical protein
MKNLLSKLNFYLSALSSADFKIFMTRVMRTLSQPVSSAASGGVNYWAVNTIIPGKKSSNPGCIMKNLFLFGA